MSVRAQYDSGWVEGNAVPGYRQEEGVSRQSQTETYVALKLTRRQLALGRRARSTCGPASACPSG